ncbi:MAG: GlsB/YeaQ/YmgE family stress response membrane protein [Anaerolineales bacterium]
MVNFIAWLIFGALAGWLASILTGKNRRMGAAANIVAGILGAFIGAGIMSTLGIAVLAGLV